MAFAATLLAASATAQSPTTGTIRGTITNATNGRTLENVVLRLAGSGKQVVSNSYGDYEFANVPAGEIEMRASYIGESDIVTRVTVTAGEVTIHDLRFREQAAKDDGAKTLELDPYVVNAERYRNARATATAEERNAVNIKTVVATDQFGYVPSGNVGEFVKFLPGVQLDYGASGGNNQGFADNAANGISVRGFGPEDTAILIDGLPVSSTLPGNLTRQVGLDQLSINNAVRIELIKVATPDMPANSIGGQVNLVTRNAFEFPKLTYSGRLFFNWNDMQSDLFKKTPGPVNKKTYKTTPGFDGSVSYPVTKNFGISASAAWSQEFSETWRAQPVWNNNQATNFQNGAFTNSAGQASSIANPVLTRYQITDSPMLTERRSGNFRVDWRPTPNQTIRANVQYSTYETAEANRRLDFRPAIANGATWDGTQVVGTTSNSTTAMTVTTRDRIGDTLSGQLQYDANFWGFQINAAGSYSVSKSDFKDEENGHFSEVNLNLNPGRVALYGFDKGIPNRAETFTRSTNLPLDYTALNNWVFDGTTAKSGESHNERTIGLYKIDVSRPLDFIPWLGSNSIVVQTGYRHDEDRNMKSGRGTGYRQILRPGSSYTVADILDSSYQGVTPGFGLAPQQWASTYKLYEVNSANNIFYVPDFDESTNTRVENYNSFVGQQKNLNETIDAWYAMANGSFFDGRLSIVGGMRQERKGRVGRTPFTDGKWDFVRSSDGSIFTDPTLAPNGIQTSIGNGRVENGVVITQPTNRPLFANDATGTALRALLTSKGIAFPTVPYGPPTGSGVRDLRARMLQFQAAREVNQHVTGDPSYSVNTAYKLTKKIDLKLAYSRSFKLQSLESGAAGGVVSGTNDFSFNEFTSTEQQSNNGAIGEIKVANPALKPETAQNWDMEASYFTDNGGKFTVSYYTKSITNQTMNFTTYAGSPAFDAVMNALGLDGSDYSEWRVVTSTNSTTKQKTSGWEFEVRQDLGFVGKWGRRVSGFVSYSMTDFPTPDAPAPYTLTNPNGTTVVITPSVNTVTLRSNRSGGAGLQYAGNRLTVQLRGTYKNDNEIGGERLTVNGQIFRKIQPAESRIDLNASYMLSKHYSLFLSGRDIFNGERDQVWRHDGGQLPDYASLADRRRFGVTWTFGVSGNW
ncbi:MAG: TonB-dependent receptor [Opitutae bacterium]|nr:TonB-dependent receptor [Opitutae bacterium]